MKQPEACAAAGRPRRDVTTLELPGANTAWLLDGELDTQLQVFVERSLLVRDPWGPSLGAPLPSVHGLRKGLGPCNTPRVPAGGGGERLGAADAEPAGQPSGRRRGEDGCPGAQVCYP